MTTKRAPTQGELVDAIADATRAAVTTLFREYPGDHFYYLALATTGTIPAPLLTAWSWEALAAAVKKRGGDPRVAEKKLKWNCVESPFAIFGEHHFERVRHLFNTLRADEDELDDRAQEAAEDSRMEAMVAAMKRLDGEGLFGRGAKRAGIYVNVEFQPPDYTNAERARRLNPPEALTSWLEEAAELE